MNERLTELFRNLFAFDVTADLLGRSFVQQALLAAALLALVAGLIGPFIVMRQMSFAVHGSSELSLTGAAFALLAGLNLGLGAIVGSVIAALMFGLMGSRVSQRDSSIGVVLAFGLGLAVLFIHLYPGRSGTAFSLLTGQIVGVSESGLLQMAIVAAIICAALIALGVNRASLGVQDKVAEARGVPVRAINMIFAVLVGLAAAQAVQVVGALLVLSLLITPAAAAAAVTSSPAKAIGLTILFAEVAAVGGMLLSLAPGVPVSVFVTALSFVIYLAARGVGALRR